MSKRKRDHKAVYARRVQRAKEQGYKSYGAKRKSHKALKDVFGDALNEKKRPPKTSSYDPVELADRFDKMGLHRFRTKYQDDIPEAVKDHLGYGEAAELEDFMNLLEMGFSELFDLFRKYYDGLEVA